MIKRSLNEVSSLPKDNKAIVQALTQISERRVVVLNTFLDALMLTSRPENKIGVTIIETENFKNMINELTANGQQQAR